MIMRRRSGTKPALSIDPAFLRRRYYSEDHISNGECTLCINTLRMASNCWELVEDIYTRHCTPSTPILILPPPHSEDKGGPSAYFGVGCGLIRSRALARAFQRVGPARVHETKKKIKTFFNKFFHVLCMYLSSKHAEMHSNTLLLPFYWRKMPVFDTSLGKCLFLTLH
jgi:hypothetical protein